MATHTFVELDLKEARRFADLAGSLHDLEQSKRYALRLLSFLNPQSSDSELSESLTISMIVSYARVFASGVRARLKDELLNQLTPEQMGLHDQFIYWRDKHISHSVNSFELNQPVARFVAETVHADGVQYIGIQSERLITPSIGEVHNFIALLEHQISNVRALYDEEHPRLLAIVRARPIEQVLRGPSRPRRAGDEPINRPRTR
jgi:hypothetical protein